MAKGKTGPGENGRDAAALARKLRNVLSADRARLRKFGRELDEFPEPAKVFLETLREDLKDREFEALTWLLSGYPECIGPLLKELADLPFHACQCVFEAAHAAGIDEVEPLRKIYAERKSEVSEGAPAAVYMMEIGHPDWTACMLEQFSLSLEHALEMAYHLRLYFEDTPGAEAQFEQSPDPEYRFIHTRYKESLELIAEEEPAGDEIEFFADGDVLTADEPVKTFLHEAGNHIANTLLQMKEEEELEFLDYASVREFARKLTPRVLNLVKAQTGAGALLDKPDDLHENGLTADPDREASPELWLEFLDYLEEMYGDQDIYNVDAFMWRTIAQVRDLVTEALPGIADGEKRERFIVDLSAAVTGRVEECLNCDRECPFDFGRAPDDPSSLLK